MAKKLKLKVPKRIAGVKIPKSARKGPIADFLNSSAGQLLLAEALIVAGRAFAIRHTDPDSTAGEIARHPIQSLHTAGRSGVAQTAEARDAIARSSARFSFAFSEAVRAFRSALEEPGVAPERAAPERNEDLSRGQSVIEGETASVRAEPSRPEPARPEPARAESVKKRASPTPPDQQTPH
jgi:hypothetical protein